MVGEEKFFIYVSYIHKYITNLLGDVGISRIAAEKKQWNLQIQKLP